MDAVVVVPLIGVQLDRPPPGSAGAGVVLTPWVPSRSGSSSIESCRFAPDRVRLIGRPVASTSRWYFDPSFPRSVGFGPVSWPPFSLGR